MAMRKIGRERRSICAQDFSYASTNRNFHGACDEIHHNADFSGKCFLGIL